MDWTIAALLLLAGVAGGLINALADREKLPRFDRLLALSLAISATGGVVGALLLLALPDRLFVLPVPALIGFSTLLFGFAPKIQSWAAHRRAGAAPSMAGALSMLAGASVYGGFFGAGLGVILTAVLSIAEPADIREVKALKNLLAAGASLAAIAIFIFEGVVEWRETASMLLGALLGGYAGGRLIKILPAQLVRWFVIVAGGAMTIIYAQRYWL
ncbi:TSUP family transporter [Methylocella sp.]|jgi:uncharacterized membrane protein YfcA|uniref:TSUP family transporter n=1 Tax=Methylocella sp. TaxID=1978226 RepID=UPI003C16FBED